MEPVSWGNDWRAALSGGHSIFNSSGPMQLRRRIRALQDGASSAVAERFLQLRRITATPT